MLIYKIVKYYIEDMHKNLLHPHFLLKNEGEAVKENYSHTHKPL